MLTIVVAPYLVSCAIATGDLLCAISTITPATTASPKLSCSIRHTHERGRLPPRQVRCSADQNPRHRAERPLRATVHHQVAWLQRVDVRIRQLRPRHLGRGTGRAPVLPSGRLVLVALLGLPLPNIFTWNVGGGGAWRFTMHAYPFFFVAVGIAVVGGWRALSAMAAATSPAVVTRATLVPLAWRSAAIAAVGLLGATRYLGLPWYATREAIAHGESTEHRDRGPRPHFLPARLVSPAPREHHGPRVA